MRPGAVAATAAVALLAGCSAGVGGAQPAPTPGATVTASGAVDAFWARLAVLGEGTASRTDTLVQASITACMDDLGFDYIPVPATESSPRDGVPASRLDWETTDFAAQWGYGVATDPDGLYASEVAVRNPNSDYVDTLSPSARQEYASALYGSRASQEGMTLEEVAAAAGVQVSETWDQRGCTGAAEHEVAGDAGTGSVFTLAEDVMYMEQSVTRDPRLAAANAAWSDCMADAGHIGLENVDAARAAVQAELDQLWSTEWQGLPAETTQGLDIDQISALVAKAVKPRLVDKEIAMAVADYGCREKVGYAKAAQEVSDEYQAAFFAEHRSEFDAIWEKAAEQSADVAP